MKRKPIDRPTKPIPRQRSVTTASDTRRTTTTSTSRRLSTRMSSVSSESLPRVTVTATDGAAATSVPTPQSQTASGIAPLARNVLSRANITRRLSSSLRKIGDAKGGVTDSLGDVSKTVKSVVSAVKDAASSTKPPAMHDVFDQDGQLSHGNINISDLHRLRPDLDVNVSSSGSEGESDSEVHGRQMLSYAARDASELGERKDALIAKLKKYVRKQKSLRLYTTLASLKVLYRGEKTGLAGFNDTLKTLISDAIFAGNTDVLEILVEFSDGKVVQGALMIGNDGGEAQDDAFHGQTALHLAVSQSNSAMVNFILAALGREMSAESINKQATGSFFTDKDKVPEGQYCLFLAAWLGCTDVFTQLVHGGAALDVQDNDGNTIIHKLVIFSTNETEKGDDRNAHRWRERSKDMYNIVFNYAETWWRESGHHRESKKKDFTKESITYLLSIKNNDGLSPLRLAAYIGAWQMFDILINSSAYRTTHFKYGPITDVSYQMNEVDSILCGNDGTSCLELIMYNSVDKTSKFITMEPFATLIKDKLIHYEAHYYLWVVMYVLYMAVFTLYMVVRSTDAKTVSDLYTGRTSTLLLRSFLELLIFLGIPWYLYGEIQDLLCPGHRHLPDPWKYSQDGFYRILRLLFIVSLLTWIIVHFSYPLNEDIVLPLCLFFGWVYIIVFTCGSEKFGIFPVMLQRMIFMDLMRFLVIFCLIVFAMTTAMFTVFQASPHIEDYSTFYNTSYSLFKMTLGMQDIDNFSEARHPGIAIFLFILYIVLGNILLLNMLIAMMGASYSAVSEKAPEFHLEHLQLVFQTLLIERRLPRLFTTIRNYQKDNKSAKYRRTVVVRETPAGKAEEEEFSLSVKKLDYMSTTGDID